MTTADRAFAAVALIALLIGAWLAVPLGLTLFPAVFERIARGSTDALAFCSGVLTGVHSELPPLGAVILGLAATAIGPALLRPLLRWYSGRRSRLPERAITPFRLRRAAARVGIAQRVKCLDDPGRYAYCAGLARPRVYVSLGAVRALRSSELEAVLLHEGHHLRRRDPFRAFVTGLLANLFIATPVVRELVARFETANELEADRAALVAQGTPQGLAGAMLVLGRPQPVLKLAPISAWSVSSARIDQLAGMGPEQLLPGVSRRALVLTAIALLVSLLLALGQAARAHVLELGLLPEAADALAHVCPLPIRGPLI